MGIFTGGNRVTGTEEPLAEAVGYRGTIGARMALIENVQNDRALFSAIIESDFQEVNMLREGADIEALTESSILAMGSKIKEFLKKVWEKIKALISSFITMLMTVIIRDNKKLVEKYRTEVLKKDLGKLKFKWSESKDGKDDVFGNSFYKPLELEKLRGILDNKAKPDSMTPEGLGAHATKIRSKDFKDDIYKTAYSLDADDLSKSFRENHYKDVDQLEGMSSSLLRNIMSALEESKDTLKAYNKAKTDADKYYNERIKEVDNDLRDAGKDKESSVSNIKRLNIKQAIAVTEQEIVTTMISTVTNSYKWKIKECRAAFARAAAFNEKLVKENAELEDAMDDVQHGIIDDLFENEMFA